MGANPGNSLSMLGFIQRRKEKESPANQTERDWRDVSSAKGRAPLFLQGSGLCAGPGGTGEGPLDGNGARCHGQQLPVLLAGSCCWMERAEKSNPCTGIQLCNSKTTNKFYEIQIRSKIKIVVSSDTLFQGKCTICKQKAMQQVRVQTEQLYYFYKSW